MLQVTDALTNFSAKFFHGFVNNGNKFHEFAQSNSFHSEDLELENFKVQNVYLWHLIIFGLHSIVPRYTFFQ